MNSVLHILVPASGLAEDKMQLGLNPATSESTTSPRQTWVRLACYSEQVEPARHFPSTLSTC